MPSRPGRQSTTLLIAIAVVACVATLFVPPVAQDLAYHDFADQRTLLGIPNFWNVVSNVPFFFIGLLGIYRLRTVGMAGSISTETPESDL